MKKSLSPATAIKPIIYFLLMVSIAIRCANSARILDETDAQPPTAVPPQLPDSPADDLPAVPSVETPPTTLPSGQIPATLPPTVNPEPQPVAAAAQTGPKAGPPGTGPVQTATASAATGQAAPPPTISFFMHDVLGGSHASGRVVTGIVATSDASGIPFSKPNNQIFPINGGIPLSNNNVNNIINSNNVPFLTGLNGQQTGSIIQNTGTASSVVNGRNNNNQPFVTTGQLPQGATLQNLIFGTITVISDQLTEGQELGSAVIGEAEGFYLASSMDGESHTMAFTAIFHGGEHDEEDTISCFGVHRTASPESQIAVIGGTGKYENAKGYATIVTQPQVDQHTTDGVDTIVQVNVYLY
ncbi:hypothetical protein Nepgr_023992 [Nepenthes gracilis]|uniref:Dirigent protein n=1 Tax=Nepenthes gracilis TaxID=150966 RepID=A0AAD3T3T3_NEPGR|nr:hypothetical protein Nepgr_023992 [Nepenthes gracilis]